MRQFVEKLQQRPHLVLSACCLALVLVMASVTSVNLALEDIAVDLKASGADLTWIADAYTVALAALVLTFGAFGDDFGRRRALVIGTLVFGVAATLAALTTSVSMLIFWRAVMGVGAAMIMPSTLSTITAVFPADQRPRAVAIWAGFASAGAVIGLLMSGALLEFFSWESTFFAIAALAAVSLLATLLCVPNTHSTEEVRPDLFGSLLTAVGIGALVYGIIEGADKGWGETLPVVSYVVAVVALTLWAIRDSRIRLPILDPRLFKLRGLSSGTLTLVLLFLGAFGFFYVGLQYVQLVLGFGPLTAALAFLPIAAVVMPLSALTPWLGERLGDKAIMAGGLFLMAVSLLLVTRLDAESGYVSFLIPMLVFAAGLAISSTPSTNVVVASLPATKQGVASALNDVTRETGAALGIALLGSLFTSGYSDAVAPATTQLPAGAAAAVEDSAAGGLHVAASPKLGEAGAVLEQQVRESFMTGMHDAFLVGAIVLLVGIAYVLLRAPGKGAVPEGEAEDALGLAGERRLPHSPGDGRRRRAAV
ncbi:MAG TPA: MFS transporter [Solirubrobacterales bacterium]|nr:MFS transporter [Solirubrobacterales bacterium]